MSDILETDRHLDKNLNDDDDSFDNLLIDETSICPIRNNNDYMIDSNGKKLISMCKATDHIIANGRFYGDKYGSYTFCSQRSLSVTDYHLLNKYEIISLHNFKTLKWNSFSDHAAVYFSFKTKCTNRANMQPNGMPEQKKNIFNEEKVPEFRELLENTINNIYIDNESETNPVLPVETLTTFLHEKANIVFGKNIKTDTDKSGKSSSNQKPKWFDEKCFSAKQEFKTTGNNFTRSKTNENRLAFTRARTKYKRTRKKTKQSYKVREGQRLENIAQTQPKQFWKSIKKCYSKPKNNTNIKLEDLYDHFNSLLGQEPDNETRAVEFQNIQNDELDCQITEEEVHKAVFKQTNGKASGSDEISADIIKASYDVISP